MTVAPSTATRVPWSVWGHVHATDTLSRAVETDRVRHAYLFGGPAGVGKRTVAREFAKALTCLERPSGGSPCGRCRSCRKIDRGVHPDVQVFDLAAQTAATAGKGTGKNTSLTIETVRSLCATAVLRPVEGKWRVIIVDDAESMGEAAQEALLKTLEEPPSFAVIVLLASDAELLLPTVRSRCQTIDFALVPRGVIERGLIARGVASGEAALLAGAAGGSPGWAVRASTDPKMLAARNAIVERALEWVVDAPGGRAITALKLADTFSKRRTDVFADLETVLGIWRDALLLKADVPAGMIHVPHADRLSRAAASWSLAQVHTALRSVRQCIADLEANVRPRLAIEAMVLQWPTP